MSFASINGVTLHYSLSGAPGGTPLILVNSLGTDLRIWDEVVRLLGPRHCVLVYDKRGHGLSDSPPGPYDIDDHVDDLLGLAALCGFERFAVCGISIGGMIAMRLAARHPAQVRHLVLADTGARIGTDEAWNERIAAVRTNGMAAIADAVAGRWFTARFRAENPAAFAGWRNMLERCSPQGYVATCASVRDTDLSGDLPHISAPTLVLVGDADVVTPEAMARGLAGTIPNARLQQVREAGHVPAIEQPRVVADLVRQHLSEVVHG
jgi:3-oxoadipate enol-lactonase